MAIATSSMGINWSGFPAIGRDTTESGSMDIMRGAKVAIGDVGNTATIAVGGRRSSE